MDRKVKAEKLPGYGPDGSERWVLIDPETGALLDDAQGYGYKTPKGAYAAWSYLNSSQDKKKDIARRKREVRKWVKDNNLYDELEDWNFQLLKMGEKGIRMSVFREWLKDRGIDEKSLPFSLSDLSRWWYL